MRPALVIIAVLGMGDGLVPVFADQAAPTAGAPELPGNSENASTPDKNAQPAPSQSATTATANSPETRAVAPMTNANAASASPDLTQAEKQLRAQGYKPRMINGEMKYCRREIPMGSNIPSALHCLTVAEAETMAKEGRETAERLQRNTSGCMSPNCGK
jgi:hypothetical protein